MPGSTEDRTRANDREREREARWSERGVCEGGRRSSRIRRTERDRKPPGTSLGTGAMSHLSYYSHSPRPDLRQTNNLSPTAATVATSLLPFSVLLSARSSPSISLWWDSCWSPVRVYIYMYTHNTLPRRRQTVLFYNGTSHGSRLFM